MKTMECTMSRLPVEILVEIMEYHAYHKSELNNISKTCKLFRVLAQEILFRNIELTL